MKRFRTPLSLPTFCAALALVVTPAAVAVAEAPVDAGNSATAAHKSAAAQQSGLIEDVAKREAKPHDPPTLPVDLPAGAQEVVDRAQEIVDDALNDVPGIGRVDVPAAHGRKTAKKKSQPSPSPSATSPANGNKKSTRGGSSKRRDRSAAASSSPRVSASRGSDRADEGRSVRLASPVADLVKSTPAAATTRDIDEPSSITRFIEFVPQRYRIAIGVLAMLCLLLAAVLIRERVRSRRAEHEAQTDPLTGLMNRRAFDAALAEEWARAQRYDRPLSLMFLDVDQFKKFNDSKGHLAGDDLLRELANMLRLELRSFDIAARLGGDEFVVACPETDNSGAEHAAHRLDQVLSGLPVRVSVGWAARRKADGTLSELMTRADRQMYRAKALASTG